MEKDLVNEETVDETIEETEEQESSIDLDKLDQINEPEEEMDEIEVLKAQLAAEKKRADEAEKKRAKDKAARDKAMRERAKLSREVQEKEEALEQPNEELEELRAIVAEKELIEKKNNLLLAATDRLAISQDMASNIVDAIYHPDTNEVDVDTLVESLTRIFGDVRKTSFDQGYDLRDTEMASQKPRSRGQNDADNSIEAQKAREYAERRKQNMR